jgi:hypothetical protein
VLLDVDAVPYVPKLFTARNPPKPVSTRLLFLEIYFCYAITNRKPSAGTHRALPQLPTTTRILRPDHLLPSAAVEAKRARIAAAQCSSGSIEDVSPQAEEEAEGEARQDSSSELVVELADALLLVPQGHRIVRKQKA